MTLAPISIATGPLPPNESELTHAQDVMRFCATRRSVLLDQLNLLQLFVDRPSRYDFSNGANAREIATAAANTQTDLDLVGRCASAAINSPSTAKFPKDFAAANKEMFPTATMPDILPVAKPRPPGEKIVPRFEGLTFTNAVLLSQQTGIEIHEEDTEEHPKMLEALQRGLTGNVHSDDQIVVNFQDQSPGSILQRRSQQRLDFLMVGYDTAPGVPL
jgi:hypothetical protein